MPPARPLSHAANALGAGRSRRQKSAAVAASTPYGRYARTPCCRINRELVLSRPVAPPIHRHVPRLATVRLVRRENHPAAAPRRPAGISDSSSPRKHEPGHERQRELDRQQRAGRTRPLPASPDVTFRQESPSETYRSASGRTSPSSTTSAPEGSGDDSPGRWRRGGELDLEGWARSTRRMRPAAAGDLAFASAAARSA